MKCFASRAAVHLTRLTTYSEIGREGTLPLALVETRLDHVCRQIAAEATTTYSNGNVDLAVDAIVGLWDADRLSEAIGNLIVNGLQHSSDRRVTGRGRRSEGRALLCIHNEGDPIPAEVRPHLFEPFRRAGERRRGSVGLGLFIADPIVRAHGGRIDVSSTKAEGTTFTIVLPLAPVDVQGPHAP